jgi:hypothetical protein
MGSKSFYDGIRYVKRVRDIQAYIAFDIESATSSVFETTSDGGDDEVEAQANHPLLSELDAEAQTRVVHSRGAGSQEVSALNLTTLLFRSPADVRRPLIIVCFVMLGQQLSGRLMLASRHFHITNLTDSVRH